MACVMYEVRLKRCVKLVFNTTVTANGGGGQAAGKADSLVALVSGRVGLPGRGQHSHPQPGLGLQSLRARRGPGQQRSVPFPG